MTRRGFALLGTLWVLVALTALAGAALTTARIGGQTTRNRILLTRAGWAREACVEILSARYAQNASVRTVDTIDLARGTWCRAVVFDPGAQLNLNRASREALTIMLSGASARSQAAVDSLVDALLDRRHAGDAGRPLSGKSGTLVTGPLADVAELRSVQGFDDALVAQLVPFVTTRGTETIDVAAAGPEVLATVPGMSPEAIAVLQERRVLGSPVQSADELAALLSPAGRKTLYASYPEFVRNVTFAPAELLAQVEGGVQGSALVSRVILTAVPVAGRLAVVRRETE